MHLYLCLIHSLFLFSAKCLSWLLSLLFIFSAFLHHIVALNFCITRRPLPCSFLLAYKRGPSWTFSSHYWRPRCLAFDFSMLLSTLRGAERSAHSALSEFKFLFFLRSLPLRCSLFLALLFCFLLLSRHVVCSLLWSLGCTLLFVSIDCATIASRASSRYSKPPFSHPGVQWLQVPCSKGNKKGFKIIRILTLQSPWKSSPAASSTAWT